MPHTACEVPVTQTLAAATFRETAETFEPGAKALPQRYFISPEVFAQEKERIFSRQWVLVGHQSQLKKSGDFFLATIAGESLIVVRDQKSEVRGFYNVCRHRGTRLKEDACGHSSSIQCPYHAWTYALDGRLIGAPHMDDLPGFDKSDYPLHRVNLGLWEGFIFVNLAEAGPLTSILSHSHSCALIGASRPCLPEGEKRDGRKPDGFVSLEDWFAPLK